jgi:N-dimethylarginine dimethylaminohydrolase
MARMTERATETSGKTRWDGRLEDYPLERYPDFVPGQPAQAHLLERFTYQDEVERIWGKRWGSQGIGRLRETVLSMPTEHEQSPLWERAPEYFLLRYQRVTGQAKLFDLAQMQEDIAKLGSIFEQNGVKVHWWEWDDTMGAYGPMRKLFIAADVRVVRGGAILPRCGHGAFKRGLEREMQKFLTGIGCPILHAFHGSAICEVGTLQNLAEDVVAIMQSNSCNEEGLTQLRFVLERTGVKELVVSQGTTTMSDLEHFGAQHLDMTMQTVDLRKVMVFPQLLSYSLYRWLREHRFEIIEVPFEEANVYGTDAVLLEPGKVIMPKGMPRTIRKLEQSGVEVIPIETKGLQQGGVNGVLCVTGYGLVRDPGPGLDD